MRLRLSTSATPVTALRGRTFSLQGAPGGVTFHRAKGDRPPTAIVHPGVRLRLGFQRPQDPPRSAFPLDVSVLEDGAILIRQPGAVSLRAEVRPFRRGSSFSDVIRVGDVESIVIRTDRG